MDLKDPSVSTPAFLVNAEAVRHNCDEMRAKASSSNVKFRPHVKTHKSMEIARMQFGGGTGPITVSTLAEAEFFAGGGFTDMTYAVPIAPAKLGRAARLSTRTKTVNILLDSRDALQAVEAFQRANSIKFDVFLKIDCGYHRAGIDPDSPETLAFALECAKSPSIRFRGLLAHAGHSYNAKNVDEIRAVAKEETAGLTRLQRKLRELGVDDVMRSIGSTPTASVVYQFADCEEVRPGNYVFYDAFQAEIGSCAPRDVAVSVLATVVGCYPERDQLIIDAGALALSKDLGPNHVDPGFGYGLVCDVGLRPLPLKLTSVSQEHGKIATAPGDAARYPVGTRLRIVPNHSCLTAAMFEIYHVVNETGIIDQWHPVRGW
jgi:D-serine deaminase-like pyridoxal phosphate-dependent protein